LEQTPNVLSGQRTLTSYFSTTKITSTEATKEDENEVVVNFIRFLKLNIDIYLKKKSFTDIILSLLNMSLN